MYDAFCFITNAVCMDVELVHDQKSRGRGAGHPDECTGGLGGDLGGTGVAPTSWGTPGLGLSRRVPEAL